MSEVFSLHGRGNVSSRKVIEVYFVEQQTRDSLAQCQQRTELCKSHYTLAVNNSSMLKVSL